MGYSPQRSKELDMTEATEHACVYVLVTQSCLTLCDPMDCSPLGSSLHGILQSKNTGVGSHALLQGIIPVRRSNPCLLHCWQILHHLQA